MVLTAGAGAAAQHVILLWPFHLLPVAAVLAQIPAPGAAALVTALLCGSNLAVTNQYYADLIVNGPTVRWTDAMDPLQRYLTDLHARRIVAADWGFMETMNLQSEGELPMVYADTGSDQALRSPAARPFEHIRRAHAGICVSSRRSAPLWRMWPGARIIRKNQSPPFRIATGGRRLMFSDSGSFTCNICGAACERPAAPPGREVPSCSACGSTVRLRSLVALLSREIFGVELAIPDFPVLKGVRGFGMSDPPELAERLAEKFEYTNTFYHQEPRLDIADPSPEHLREHTGRYDFILSSEVLEHVPPPVERAFVNLNRMLKPDGLLLLTVPYRIDGRTAEHFPELHEYALASPGGRTVLVNRRRDGSLEVFENLSFHGGDGSTLEMRVFTETSLKEIIAAAGFTVCTSLRRTSRSSECSTERPGRCLWSAGKGPISDPPSA